MVHVNNGVLIECDPQMKQFLLHLDETSALNKRFVIQDLDATHLFVESNSIQQLKDRIEDLMEKVNYVETN